MNKLELPVNTDRNFDNSKQETALLVSKVNELVEAFNSLKEANDQETTE